jgi:hypothetical protein
MLWLGNPGNGPLPRHRDAVACKAAIPAGRVSVQSGVDWLRGMTAAILEVPSVIVPEEKAALINPLHPDAKTLSAKTIRLFEYDKLFRRR